MAAESLTGASTPQVGALLVKFGAAVKASVLIPIGAATIAGAGVIGVVQLRSAPEKPPPAEATISTSSSKNTLRPLAPPKIDAPSAAIHQGPVMRESPAEAPRARDARAQSSNVESNPSAARMPASASPQKKDAPEKSDWLGEQFEMLARARRSLAAGQPDAALKVLDDYAQRFPEGSLAPEAARLRQKAYDTRTKKKEKPRTYILD